MNTLDRAVIGGGLGPIACLLWYGFGPKQGKAAAIHAIVQEATMTMSRGTILVESTGCTQHFDQEPRRDAEQAAGN